MNMKDWDNLLVQFLELADYPILKDNGKISMLEAKLKAESEYDKFRVIQDQNYVSDFDKEMRKLIDKKKKQPMPNLGHVTYDQTGKSKSTNELGMREMQEKC